MGCTLYEMFRLERYFEKASLQELLTTVGKKLNNLEFKQEFKRKNLNNLVSILNKYDLYFWFFKYCLQSFN